MICYKCGQHLGQSRYCGHCGADVWLYKKIIASSNVLYNEALNAAKERDLTGACELLKRCLRLNKNHIDARNLLGLVYHEMGQMSLAIEEWYISRALMVEDNEADRYIDDLCGGAGRDNVSQMIRKYNAALGYIAQGSYDLATLQMKNVLSLNPNYVEGHEVLGLIYASEGDYDKAKQEFRAALRVNKTSSGAKKYAAEVDRLKKESAENPRRKKKESVSYRNGNDTIIQPIGNYFSTPIAVVLNLVVGIAIGALAVYFLVVPGMRSAINNAANQSIAEANEQLATQETSVKSLEDEIENLKDQIAAYESADARDDDRMAAYWGLAQYYMYKASGEDEKALAVFEQIDPDILTGDAAIAYKALAEEIMSEKLAEYWSVGSKAFSAKKYSTAIENFEKAVEIDEEYQNGQLLYNLASAYRLNGDTDKAVSAYQRVVELFANTNIAKYSKNYIESLTDDDDENDSADYGDTTTTSGTTSGSNNTDSSNSSSGSSRSSSSSSSGSSSSGSDASDEEDSDDTGSAGDNSDSASSSDDGSSGQGDTVDEVQIITEHAR